MNSTQQTTQQTMCNQPSLVSSLLPIVLIIAVFYFLIMRPQQKKEKERQQMINSVKKGDKIVMSSGIIGIIHKILNDKEAVLEIAENVRIRVLTNSISTILENNAQIEVESKKPEPKINKTTKSKKDTANTKTMTTKETPKDSPTNIEK